MSLVHQVNIYIYLATFVSVFTGDPLTGICFSFICYMWPLQGVGILGCHIQTDIRTCWCICWGKVWAGPLLPSGECVGPDAAKGRFKWESPRLPLPGTLLALHFGEPQPITANPLFVSKHIGVNFLGCLQPCEVFVYFSTWKACSTIYRMPTSF